MLRGVRGFYTTYDRNYSYIGVRGFARPGDYNTRVLLLIDGHRVNDGVYDMAPMGTDFLFDISLIDRIEVIRGPGSSLYGTNALFGVINVITKSGASRKGAQAEVVGGSLSDGQGARQLWPCHGQRPRVTAGRIDLPIARPEPNSYP